MIPHGVFDWVCLVYGVASVPPIVLEIRRRRKAGEVLLDLSDRNVRLLGFGALTFLLGVFELFFYAPQRSMGFLWLGWAGYNFAAGTRRLQIRRAGFFGRRLTPWGEIAGYDLDDRGTLSLDLRDRGWVTWARNLRYEQRDRLTGLLEAGWLDAGTEARP